MDESKLHSPALSSGAMLFKNINGQLVNKSKQEPGAALATNRAAARVTSRFRDIEHHAEANFSRQLRGFLSEITTETAKALEAQRRTLAQETTAQMIWRVAQNADTLSQLTRAPRHHKKHAECQSDEFQV